MQKKKTNREVESEKTHGKKHYQIRKQLEKDGDLQIKEFISPPSCLDSAYERLAIARGLEDDPVFPENKEYMESLKNG